jgi:hypothetical protein
VNDLRYVAYPAPGGGYACGAPSCGTVYWVDTPTDTICENGHAVPDWQVEELQSHEV